jgi:3D-(3,5/4)-trihydroxycyclohexane-1,2-dione acylhydrolase (decyclizing)
MLNSEIATAVRMGVKLTVVLLDNGGFGCIERLQQATGNASFNNLTAAGGAARVDFVAHAASLGADASAASDIAALERALTAARDTAGTTVLVIETDPAASTPAGGTWWDVPVAEVSTRAEVRDARARYLTARATKPGDS